MMKTFEVYTLFDHPPEKAEINTELVAWVSPTEECGMRDRRQTCNVHFSGGGICSYVIGTREEITARINEANRVKAPEAYEIKQPKGAIRFTGRCYHTAKDLRHLGFAEAEIQRVLSRALGAGKIEPLSDIIGEYLRDFGTPDCPAASGMNYSCVACASDRHDRCERRYPLPDGVRAHVCYCRVCCWDSGRLEFTRHSPNPCPTGPSKFKPPKQMPARPEGWCWTCASGQHGNGCEAAERFGQLRPDGTPWNMDHFCRCGCKKDRGR